MLKHWNMVLIILTYCAGHLRHLPDALGRAVVGALPSPSRAIGPMFFVFIGLTFVTSLSVLISRWPDLAARTSSNSMLSREALFLLNNLLFMGILVVCFWGVIFPLISEMFTGQKVTVGPPFYERATGPLWAGLLAADGRGAALGLRTHVLERLWGGACLEADGCLAARADRGGGCSASRNLAALLGFWLVGLVVAVVAYEFWRGALARRKLHGENLLAGAGPAGRTQPAPLRRLHHPPGRGGDGHRHHRHRALPDGDAGHAGRGEQITLGRYVMTYDCPVGLRHGRRQERRSRRGHGLSRTGTKWASCTRGAISTTPPSSR